MSEKEVLPKEEISEESRRVAETLHREARTEVIYTIVEQARRNAWLEGFIEGRFQQIEYEPALKQAQSKLEAKELYRQSNTRLSPLKWPDDFPG